MCLYAWRVGPDAMRGLMNVLGGPMVCYDHICTEWGPVDVGRGWELTKHGAYGLC